MNYQEQTVNLPNCTVNVTTYGKGQPLFLIPGWPFSSKIYLFLEPYLSKKYQVTSVDLPGWSGKSYFTKDSKYTVESYLNIIAQVINQVYGNKEKFILGGVSIGGTLSLTNPKI